MPAVLVLVFSVQPVDIPDPVRVPVVYTIGGGPGRIVFTGAQTVTLDLSTMPAAGLRALRIVYDAVDDTGTAVTAGLRVNMTTGLGSASLPLGPGGALMLADPNVTGGISALSLVSTAPGVAHVTAAG